MGGGSLATSSDWTTTRVALSTGSTSYSTAATARWTKDTNLVVESRTSRPTGEIQRACRRSTPARRSNTRSWERSCP